MRRRRRRRRRREKEGRRREAIDPALLYKNLHSAGEFSFFFFC
jgi:hypothetical protein